jgi:hypothetical protein
VSRHWTCSALPQGTSKSALAPSFNSFFSAEVSPACRYQPRPESSRSAPAQFEPQPDGGNNIGFGALTRVLPTRAARHTVARHRGLVLAWNAAAAAI